MLSNFFNPIFLCILISLFNFPTTKARDATDAIGYVCSINNESSANSAYEENRRILLSSLSSKATHKTFYNDTVVGTNSSDTVYGMFMCRGDIDLASDLCIQCVGNATNKLFSDSVCSSSKVAVTWYDNCMVRYSNVSFFSTMDTDPGISLSNGANISSDAEIFNNLLANTMRNTANEAANTSNRYSTKEAILSQYQTLYCLAQCTQDLSTQNCSDCLEYAISSIPGCCDGKMGGRVLFPSCNIRYELYPFYNNITDEEPQGLVPETKYSHTDSEYSEDPGYIFHNCSTNKKLNDNGFQSDIETLFSDMASNASGGGGNKYKIQSGTVQGLFTCRGDLSPRLCEQCVRNATEKIASDSECDLSTEGVIWYNHCWLRYSTRSLTLETSPRFVDLNLSDSHPLQTSVASKLSNKIAAIANDTGDIGNKYQTQTLVLNDKQTVYIVAQCTLDLSSTDCGGCLNDVIGSAIVWARLGSVGGRVLYPSCILRFEMFKFYDLTASPPPPPPGNGSSRTVILIVTFSIIVSGILFIFGCYLIRKKVGKNNKTILQENFGHESSAIESLQFNLAIIEATTNNFSNENKIGKGGFGLEEIEKKINSDDPN
ncbi:putative cysteine-rich receptor-like protein kinase 23 [Cajanus cajan]|uniref:putative cysteine-rich receptor-like protein kinase 23 n=1 Tax=Cajanus cajan TaxID=3821 RepID=UPI0010FB6894|nr:putative cysteine-rich receptor-like protein kinase 23 [Cajanus cajan]